MNDYRLTGIPLEERVADLFGQAGFNVSPGRPGKEDGLVQARADWIPQIAMVVEVKSTTTETKTGPTTDHLRQLDDYVFELSGEMEIRRRTLTRWKNPLLREQRIGTPEHGITYLDTAGAIPYSPVHPAAYKGVLVFNGPTTTPFDERPENWLRGWVDACEFDSDRAEFFGQVLHATFGLCPDPPT